MVPIKNKIICLIFFVNITGIILNFVLMNKKISSNSSKFFSKRSQVQNNEISYSYKNEDNYDLSKIKGNEKISKENIKSLRKLSNYEDQQIYVIILSFLSIYFTVSLLFTINNENPQENQKTQENQTNQTNQIKLASQANQTNNARNNDRGGFNFIFCGGGNDIGIIGLVFVVGFLLIIIVFLISKIYMTMGKKKTAYCSLIFLLIIYMLTSIICFGFIPLDNSYAIGGICSGLFIFNFLVILIPNLNCRKRQDNNDIEIIDSKNPKLIPENDDSCIIIKDDLALTPIIKEEDNGKMNYNEAPVGNMEEIDVFEKIIDKYDQRFDNKNENNKNERESYSRNSELSNAPPPPNDESFMEEKEIYKNYSNL